MLKIKDLFGYDSYGYDACSSFMVEFIGYMERSKLEEIDFVEFMNTMYGGIEDFKKYNLRDMKEAHESIIYYVKKYKQIADLVEKVSDEK